MISQGMSREKQGDSIYLLLATKIHHTPSNYSLYGSDKVIYFKSCHNIVVHSKMELGKIPVVEGGCLAPLDLGLLW